MHVNRGKGVRTNVLDVGNCAAVWNAAAISSVADADMQDLRTEGDVRVRLQGALECSLYALRIDWLK